METFSRLFGSLLAFVYHCFDRLVIQGYLPLLTRPENIVHFFREVHGIRAITKEVLRERTTVYQKWVEAFARNHGIPIEWAQKGVRKEDYVRPQFRSLERQNRYGVYFILKSMERGVSFRSSQPKFPTSDPDYRILHRQFSRFTHYYFYIRDEVLGPFVMCAGSFLPFHTTYYLNGHQLIENELKARGIDYRKNDNAFLWVSDPEALQAVADSLSPQVLQERLDYWTLILGPKFSRRERQAVRLHRHYSINQVEYCRNFIFRRHFPIHHLFERSCDLGLARLTSDALSQIFGFRLTKKLRGKLHTTLEKLDYGHHVLRGYCKSTFLRMYEKFSTFLRIEVCCNRLADFGLKKSLEHLPSVARVLAAVTDRVASFQAESLNVNGHFPLFQRLAQPIVNGRTRVPGIKIQDTRMIRLMEILLHSGTQVGGWRSADIHSAVLAAFGLAPDTYSLTQLRYDLRKMKAHGLVERLGKGYRYRLTAKGIRVALLFVLFHKRVCGPLAASLFLRRPDPARKPPSKIEAAYRQADASIQNVIDLLAA